MADNINHPTHYNNHPSGVECITITEHMNFNLGNAIKYIWRAGLKIGPAARLSSGVNEKHIEDLKKARWYIDREIMRILEKPIEVNVVPPFKMTTGEVDNG